MQATREVPLTRGLVAIVDASDYEAVVAQGKWHASQSRNTFYARRSIRHPDGRITGITMHRFLTGWPMVDHANRDGLDNRRENLRPANHAQNGQNRIGWGASGLKGVYYSERGNCRRYTASIRVNGRTHEYWGLCLRRGSCASLRRGGPNPLRRVRTSELPPSLTDRLAAFRRMLAAADVKPTTT